MFELTPFRRRREVMNSLLGGDMLKEFNDFWYGATLGMKADIMENEQEYIVEAELPGIKKENINVELKEHTLTIAATQDEETKDEGVNYVRRERKTGSVSRSFYVENVDQEGVKADYSDGVLKIVLPKLKDTPPDRYQVKID